MLCKKTTARFVRCDKKHKTKQQLDGDHEFGLQKLMCKSFYFYIDFIFHVFLQIFLHFFISIQQSGYKSINCSNVINRSTPEEQEDLIVDGSANVLPRVYRPNSNLEELSFMEEENLEEDEVYNKMEEVSHVNQPLSNPDVLRELLNSKGKEKTIEIKKKYGLNEIQQLKLDCPECDKKDFSRYGNLQRHYVKHCSEEEQITKKAKH